MWQSHDLKGEVLKKLNESPKAKRLKTKSLVAELLSTGLAKTATDTKRKGSSKR